ncbi:unnamed protein product [Gongylonema pulchrum]|uniref:DUF3967 domain-containing protein n=1 Tax=Gongylonema pulchrum TaxID=637853 RepID=A0A183DSW7_9BILA|nr:unnamed protein product [Gongylonema pulchrum]
MHKRLTIYHIISAVCCLMSHQPIRVAQPPTQTQSRSQAAKSYQSSSSTKYDNLIRVAEQQRCLIDANRRTIQLWEARGNRVDNAPIRLAVLRNEVLYEEREMARLKMMEREAKETASRRVVAEKQLSEMQANYTWQEQHLRSVISKITSLQAQV